MANGGDIDQTGGIVDALDHAVIPDAQPPKVLVALQLDRPGRTWSSR